MGHGPLYIRIEITLGKYQEQLLHLEKRLETGLYCELMSKELKDGYPHMLIAGGTGGGKTYFILTIIEVLLCCNAIIMLFYFNLPYTSSFTGSNHSFVPSTPGTSIARWLNQLSGAAPCQCLTLIGILMQSPDFISIASLPSS